jgi:hypothetical protein
MIAGRAELQFDDPFTPDGGLNAHNIWVAPEFIGRTGI